VTSWAGTRDDKVVEDTIAKLKELGRHRRSGQVSAYLLAAKAIYNRSRRGIKAALTGI